MRNADQSKAESAIRTIKTVIQSKLSESDLGVIRVEPTLASLMLENINYDLQRPVKQWRVELHEHRIIDGSWRPLLSDIHVATLPDGRWYIVNGQHRLHGIAKSKRPTETRFTLIEVDDEKELRKLYIEYDQQISNRSQNELVKASDIDRVIDIKAKTAESLIKAVAIIENAMEPDIRQNKNVKMKDFSYRNAKAMEWAREAKYVQRLLDMSPAPIRSKLLRSSTMSVMLYTLRHQPRKAGEFWRTLVENDGLAKRDPRNTLYTDLLSRNLSSGNIRQGVQQSILAWNAWYSGRELRIIKCITGAPLSILGTPLDKGAK